MGGRYPNQPQIIRVGPALVLVTPKVVAKQFGIGVRKASNFIRLLGVPMEQIGDTTYLSQQALETALYAMLLPDAVRATGNAELNAYLQEIHSLQFCFVSSKDIEKRLKLAGELLQTEVRNRKERFRHPRIDIERGLRDE